jgi:tetratricopeptide (TPR) repeat protein
MQEARQGNAKGRQPAATVGKARQAGNVVHQQSFQQFQHAVQFMQEGKFEKARALFEKLAQDGAPELLDRSRVYLAVCTRHAAKTHLTFASLEEQYDYAVSLLNQGQYEDARDQFDGLIKKKPEADFAHYGLAVLNSMTGQAEDCLDHLARAIELNSQNRIQARSDTDFADMADDPRFTELLYPEAP